MATLFNTKIKDTYQSLLKLEDNTILTTTTKNVTDGLGNASPLYMSTTRIGVGTNAPAYALDVQGTAASQLRVKSTTAGAYIDYSNSSGSTYSFGAYLDGFITVFGGTVTSLLKSDGTNTFGNTLTSLGARLGIKGLGSTQATTSLLVQNSGGSQMFRIYDDGGILARDLALTSQSIGISGTGIYSTGTDATLIAGFSLGGFTLKNWSNSTVSLQNTANPRNAVSIQQCGFNDGNNPNLVGNTLNISPIYNFVGTWTGTIVRGIYYNPTLTSLVNTTHTAIETVTGNVLLGTTSGNVLIGTTTNSGYKLDVNGSTRVKGNSLTLSASGLSSPPANYVGLNFDENPNHHEYWYAINSKKDLYGAIGVGYDRIIFPTMGNDSSTWEFNALGSYSRIRIAARNNTAGNFLDLTNSSIGFCGPWTVASIDRTNRKLVFGNMSTDVHHIAVYDLVIKGAQPFEGNINVPNGGNVYVVGGTPSTSPAGNYGNVLLAHDGTSARGNVGVGEASPTARLQVKGSGSTSATSSLLVQNSSGTNLLNVRDDAKTIIPTGGGGTIVMGSLNANTNGMSLVGYYADGSNSAIYTENYNNGTLKTYLGGAFYGVTTDLTQTFSSGSRGGIGFRVAGNVNNTGGSLGDIGGYTFEPNILSLTGGSVVYAFNSTIGGAYFNTNTRQASAILQADSTTKGFLPPRMLQTQRTAIASPAVGLMVYQTDMVEGLYIYKSTGWTFII
jgi:hypothetical protein